MTNEQLVLAALQSIERQFISLHKLPNSDEIIGAFAPQMDITLADAESAVAHAIQLLGKRND